MLSPFERRHKRLRAFSFMAAWGELPETPDVADELQGSFDSVRSSETELRTSLRMTSFPRPAQFRMTSFLARVDLAAARSLDHVLDQIPVLRGEDGDVVLHFFVSRIFAEGLSIAGTVFVP